MSNSVIVGASYKGSVAQPAYRPPREPTLAGNTSRIRQECYPCRCVDAFLSVAYRHNRFLSALSSRENALFSRSRTVLRWRRQTEDSKTSAVSGNRVMVETVGSATGCVAPALQAIRAPLAPANTFSAVGPTKMNFWVSAALPALRVLPTSR